MDITLFIKKKGDDIIVVQIYVDNIIFGATNESFYSEFETSMIGELNFLLGL